MKMKQVCSIAMAGVMTLGVALGSGVSAYAAPEDWFKIDTDSRGSRQPSVSATGWDEGHPDWEISYGYTIHPGYKYVLRICDDNTREWGKSAEGYGYYNFEYWHLLPSDKYEAGAELEIPWALEDLGSLLLFETEQMTNSIPAGEELFIRGFSGMDDWDEVLATGYMMVYDTNGSLVDSFPLQSQPADNTASDVPAVEAAADTDVPVADTTVPAADSNVNSQPAVDQGSSEAVVAVAKEVVRGRWGVGKERRIRLETAGYDYTEVQEKVCELMK